MKLSRFLTLKATPDTLFNFYNLFNQQPGYNLPMKIIKGEG